MKTLAYILSILLLSGCASYYQRNIEIQRMILSGKLDDAEKKLEGDKRIQRDRNRLLYLFDMGFINHLQQDYAKSNEFFNEADLLIEDYKKSFGAEALALISNPEVKPYKPEDFESVMVHYYKSLNYLLLSEFDASIVEAKRMNLVLNQLNDKYKDHKNRYQADAFAHILIGLSYEASKDLNNAFIAYRNAFNIYTGEHGYFDISAPEQLKSDLLRCAYLLGFQSDLEFYEREFGRKYEPRNTENGELVFLWHNGMGPIKDEVSFNFIAIPGQAGYVIFENAELGISFPFYIGEDKKKRDDLLALRVVRVAFPKYLERPTYYKDAHIMVNGQKHPLELMENINDIAFKTLKDRFLREMGVSLLRLGLKKAAEIKLAQENVALGAAATITNAITEKADTRNWQTLPHSVYYQRARLDAGDNVIGIRMQNVNKREDKAGFTLEAKLGLQFLPYYSLEHLPAAPWDDASSVRVKNQ